MTRNSGSEAGPDRILYSVKGFIYLTAAALGFVGFFLLYTAWATRNSDDWWLGWRDPVLGLSNRAMLVLGGTLHLGVTAYLVAARDLATRSLAVLWLGLNHLVYYAGIVLLEPSTLANTERFLGWRLQLSPSTAGDRWRILQGYLIVASVVFLLLLWRRSKRLRDEAWFKHWELARTQQPKTKPVIPKDSEASNIYAKNVCPHCGQKNSFPLSRLGECIACPQCAGVIILRSPPASMAAE